MILKVNELLEGDVFLIDGDIFTVTKGYTISPHEFRIEDASQDIVVDLNGDEEVLLLLRD